MKLISRSLGIGIGSLVLHLMAAHVVSAQIVPDNTLPVNSSVEAGCTRCAIGGGTVRGTNLFHSFREFSVPPGGAAIFNHAMQIQNILTRVTGSSISKIDGLLQTSGTANLFLLNPNGVIFGPDARLDVRGSFVASTANAIAFPNGETFSASNPTQPSELLTINPNALLVNQLNPQPIINRSTADTTGLTAAPGQSLAFVGGEVRLEGGRLTAPGGRIELGSVGTGSSVAIAPTNPGWALNYQGVQQFQDIRLTQAARVNAGGNGGGSIQVQGRRLTLTEGSQILTATQGSQSGSDLIVRATESVEIIGSTRDGSSSRLAAQVNSGATGNGGNLTIQTGILRLVDGANVSTTTFGAGNGGNLTVQAQLVDVIGFDLQDYSFSFLAAQVSRDSTGNGGNLTIETEMLRVTDGARVSTTTFGAGKGGSITVRAQLVEVIGSNPLNILPSALLSIASSTGPAGSLTLETRTLRVADGAQVSSATFGAGKGGDLAVRAQSVEVIGFDPLDGASSFLSTSTNRRKTGNAGNLTIETGTLRVVDGAVVSTNTAGVGKGGDLRVRAQSVDVIGFKSWDGSPSLLTAQTNPGSTGKAGGIVLTTDRLHLANRGEIIATSEGTGSAGNIEIQANSRITLDDEARISSNTNAGQGNITLTTPLLLLRRGSRITTNAGGSADGGNIRFNGGFIVAVPAENSDISANAVAGRGGRVDITTQGLFGIAFRPRLTPLSDITASSEFGIAGVVTINTPNVDPSQGLAELPTNLVDASRIVAVGCVPAVAAQPNRGEFYQTGRGGIAPSPIDAVGSSDILEDLQPPQSWTAATQPNAPIVEAQAVEINDRGEILLVAAPTPRWRCGR
jgi:filamentous hemagglutinin family protein